MALEKEIGVQVKAETEVANLKLVKDRILTKAEGYVKELEDTGAAPEGKRTIPGADFR